MNLGCWKKSLRSPSSYCFWIWSDVFKIPPKKKVVPQRANLAAFGNTEGVANNDGQWCLAPWCNYFQHCSGISTMDSIFELLEEVSRGALSVMMGDGVARGPWVVPGPACMKVQSFLETCCCLSRGFASGWVVQDGLGRCQWLMCKTSWPVGISESEHMKGKVLTSTFFVCRRLPHNHWKIQQFNYILHMNSNSYISNTDVHFCSLLHHWFRAARSKYQTITVYIMTQKNEVSVAWSCVCVYLDLYQHTTLVIP